MKTNTDNQQVSRSLFVSLLKQEYSFRKEKNARYSIRSFAKCLDIDQSFLSKILNGKRLPSTEMILKANKKLRLELAQKEEEAKDTDENTYQRVEDVFHLISEWYYFALLELIRTEDFISDERWICRRLGINIDQLKVAVVRLCRLGYIEIKDGKWILLSPSLSWSNIERTDEARTFLQKQISLMSHLAIEDTSFELRDHSSLTVALDVALIPELKRKITKFRRSLDKYIVDSSSSPKEVYNFTFSMYPVTRDLGGKK